MKNLVKFLTIGLLSLSLIASCSKDPINLPPTSSDEYPKIYVDDFGPERYTGYLKKGAFCGEVVYWRLIEKNTEKTVYSVEALSRSQSVVEKMTITYNTSDIREDIPGDPLFIGYVFCVNKRW